MNEAYSSSPPQLQYHQLLLPQQAGGWLPAGQLVLLLCPISSTVHKPLKCLTSDPVAVQVSSCHCALPLTTHTHLMESVRLMAAYWTRLLISIASSWREEGKEGRKERGGGREGVRRDRREEGGGGGGGGG